MSIKHKAAAVTFSGVTKTFGSVVAVDHMSFTVEAGTLVTLLGPSGCGKTTTLRVIAGLEMVTAGRVWIGSEDVTHLPATDRDVSMVFQSYALFPHMTVRENVSYGLRVGGLAKAETRTRAEAGLELVGLQDYGERLPSELSGGQQQRVAVARALVLEPQVLLFDEPLSNLDAKLRRQVREDIRELQQRLGLTSVYVTHDQEEALAVSDHIIVMNNAVIAQQGTPRQLYEEPADSFVANFIGDANLVDVEIIRIDGEWASVRLGTIDKVLPSRGLKTGRAKAAIRPEALRLSPPGSGSGMPGCIRKTTYLGSHMEYRVDSPLGELFVINAQVDQPIPADAPVTLTLADHGVTLMRNAECRMQNAE